jgi:uncharacterized NAD(P)/FAD-binding protein YdhS
MLIPSSKKRTIAIIGAGYSGTLTAVNILRTSPPDNVRVVLVEQDSTPGRGLAYRFADDNHLLNVPAGNMSALADEPSHFVAYCRNVDPAFNTGSFISRRLYGEYLQYTLAEAETNHPGTLEKINGEAVAILPDASHEKFRIGLAGGASLEATQVVLAFGNFSRGSPQSVPANLRKYLVNPWDFSALDGLDQKQPVAILGTGHTAVDVLFRLTSCNRTRKIFLLSRRGLLPHGHRFNPTHQTASEYPAYLVGLPPTIRAYTRALREEATRREAAGGNWRDVLNELRPHTSRLWRALPEAERIRSLQKIRPYWDVHRHRFAPSAARRLENLLDSGQVKRLAGRITGFDREGVNLSIQFKSRGEASVERLDVGAVVNCTGPNNDLSSLSVPLVTQLRNEGLIQQDCLKLGLLVDDGYRVIDVHNQANPGLFYVGPMLKARYWEASAVPELRNHIRRLAEHLMLTITPTITAQWNQPGKPHFLNWARI